MRQTKAKQLRRIVKTAFGLDWNDTKYGLTKKGTVRLYQCGKHLYRILKRKATNGL